MKLEPRDSAYTQRRSQPWQNQALQYYDLIGELRFASHFIARMMSRVRYFPAILGDDGKIEEINEGAPVEQLDRIQDPGGGRSQLQYRYGLLQIVTGEGVLFGSRLQTDLERWKFLWKEEVEIRDDGSAVRLDASRQPVKIRVDGQLVEDVGVGYRMWTPHPRHSDEADSPVRSIMEVCEELIILTKAVRSTAVSRLPNGMLIIPTEANFGPVEAIGDEDPENIPVFADLIDHITGVVENAGSAEAASPFVYELANEFAPNVRWMQMHDPQSDYLERDLRIEAIKRMALGMDMPPEALLGMTDANHWTAKQVMHDMWRSHGIPKAEQFADDLSEAYLRPALQEEEYEQWERVVVGIDDSQVVISPDRTEDADKALDRIAIGFPGYRQLKGIPEDMAPTDEEKEFLATLKLRQVVELDGQDLVVNQRGPQPSMNGTPPAEEGPPEPTGGRDVSRQESRTASAEILGAAKMALRRCREMAGGKLRSRYQHECSECREITDGHPNSLVASLLGPEQVLKFGIKDPMKLVAGGADGFRDLLVESGIDETQASALKQTLEVWAGKTLFDQRPSLPAGFVASVEKAQEISGALVD